MRILILLTLMLLSEPVFSQEGVLEKNVKAVIELKYEREKKELDEFKAKKLADNNPLFTNMYLDSLYKALAQSSKYNHSLYDVSLLLKEYSNLVTYPKTDSLTSKIAAKFELLRTYDEQIKPMAFLLTLPTDFLYSLTLSEINSELKNALPDLTRENVEMKINKVRTLAR